MRPPTYAEAILSGLLIGVVLRWAGASLFLVVLVSAIALLFMVAIAAESRNQ